jgi:phosphoesterase family protein
VLALAAGTALVAVPAATATATAKPAKPARPAATAAAAPRLSHVFLIIEENNGFSDVIGNKAAPNLNYLAKTFGLETDYFGVSPCCSESNYVQLLSGRSWASVQSDDAYWKNKVPGAPNLISQLDHAGVSWKAYLQALPHPGYQGICYPAKCNGAPDSDPLYVSKHDGIQNFTKNWNPLDWSRQVPAGQLGKDLTSGRVPKFSYVIPDECHDMHGDPPYCLDSGNTFDPQNQHLVSVGDAYLGQLVSEITHASVWAEGNNAIIITFDEGDDSAGCCDAVPGAGRVATVVVTSHGPRAVRDSQPDAVTATPDGRQVWVAGEADSPRGGGKPVVEHLVAGSGWNIPHLPAVPGGANWSNLYGVAIGGGSVYVTGTFVNPATGNNGVLLLKETGGTWSIAGAPNPGGPGGSDIAGGIANTAGQLWMAGTYNTATSSNLPLVEHH